MPNITNLNRLRTTIRRLARKHGAVPSVIVGYTAAYALPVHENLEAHHDNGQAKYLEQPARTLSNDGTLGNLVGVTVRSGATLEQGLLVAGLRLQRESQLLVPVDTGNLKGSAVTRKE